MNTAEQLQAAIEAFQKNDWSTATALCQKILTTDPQYAEALNLLGVLQQEQHQYEQAIIFFKKAIDANPNFHAPYFNLASVFKTQQQLELSLNTYQQALQIAPDHIDTRLALADVYIQQNEHNKALLHLDHILKIAPALPMAHQKAGAIFLSVGQLAAADEHGFYAQLYEALAINDFSKVVEACNQFLLHYPHHVNALIHKGLALEALEQFHQAIECYDQAFSLDSNLASALFNKSNALNALGLYQEALTFCDAAIALQPNFTRAIINRAFLRLRLGQYVTGWEDYESRLESTMDGRSGDRIVNYYQFKNAQWTGEPKPNDYLHLWSEQGIGDEILFSSLFSEVASHFKHVIIETDPRLVDLFKRSFSTMEVIARKPVRKDVFPTDKPVWHLPFGSLGQFFRKSSVDFKPNTQYLIADESKTAQFINKLKKNTAIPLIGIAWGSNSPTGKHKTLPFETLAKTLTPHSAVAQWVCLQYHATNADKTLFEQITRTPLTLPDIDVYNQLDDFAALINACDYVITSSNVTAHIAGALGKTTFLLVPAGSGLLWYWGAEGSTTPWYPSIRIIRQSHPGDWNSVFSALDTLLQQHLHT